MSSYKNEIDWSRHGEILAAIESLATNPIFQIELRELTLQVKPAVSAHHLPLVQALAPIYRNALNQIWVSEQVIARRISGSVKTLQNLRWRGSGPPYGMPYGGVSRAIRYNLFEFDAWLASNTFHSTSEATVSRHGR